MLFDTHTHLNVDPLYAQAAELIQRAKENGVKRFAVVGFDTDTINRALTLADTYEEVYAIIGWHPTEARLYTPKVEEWLIAQLQHPKVVAVGEMGLDYYWNTASRQEQETVFRRQLAIARELQLPVSIHNRDATEDVYRILKEEKVHTTSGIMHSFGEGPDWMNRFVDLGMYLSFSGVVTFKKAQEVRESAARVPADRYLVETDAPYLSPVPYRGKQNEPSYTRYVAMELAKAREVSVATVEYETTRNAACLFRLKGMEHV